MTIYEAIQPLILKCLPENEDCKSFFGGIMIEYYSFYEGAKLAIESSQLTDCGVVVNKNPRDDIKRLPSSTPHKINTSGIRK
jgi:hypothetical protein